MDAGITCVYYDMHGVQTCIRCRVPADPYLSVRKCIESTEGFDPPPFDYQNPQKLTFRARFLHFWADFGQFLRSGCKILLDSRYRRRLSVCKGCPLLKNGICSSCGCIVRLRAAAATLNCPEGKW